MIMKVDIGTAVLDALTAAKTATNAYIGEYGENQFGCGFAWVVVKGIRGKKADTLKAMGFRKRYDGPGLSLWNPSGHITQDMDAKYEGAKAFAMVLRAAGLDASAQCRLD